MRKCYWKNNILRRMKISELSISYYSLKGSEHHPFHFYVIINCHDVSIHSFMPLTDEGIQVNANEMLINHIITLHYQGIKQTINAQ